MVLPDRLGVGSLMSQDGGAPADVTSMGLESDFAHLMHGDAAAATAEVDVIGTEEFWVIPEDSAMAEAPTDDATLPVAKLVDIKKVPLFIEEDLDKYRAVRSARRAAADRRRDRRLADRRLPACQKPQAVPAATPTSERDLIQRPAPFARYMGSRLTAEERQRADEALARNRYERKHPTPVEDGQIEQVEDQQIAV